MMVKARVLIVEDEAIVAEQLRFTLESSGYAVVGNAAEGEEAAQLARALRPDVILMDLALRGSMDGMDAMRAICKSVDAAVILVSGHASESIVSHAARIGACAYIVKPFQPQQITSSIQMALHHRAGATLRQHQSDVMERNSTIAPGDVSRRVRRSVNPAHASITVRMQRTEAFLANARSWSGDELPVTSREREIIHGLICYRRLAAVANVLGISVHTARNHLKSVFRKLDLHSQDELLQFLLERTGS